ncbi:cobalamin-binding protein [Nitrosopumilus oxyclinae]|uniref:Cobalamin-binding protein n=1 Tax=Nitrosopumilus oxyclinae TaxID=1959104 RepID=A0A7D5M173_9ARCH|nr:cobalamin-binding protein [Nitrosopumilus oxyclinae]QLH04513.1 cobalamin-binding protein [Nitrosopumilus oxyclinae]
MTIKRIVSFLPSATELLYEFGIQDDLYGVTHECKYPKDAVSKPKVINSVINSDELSSKEIDTATCQLLKDGKDIFVLNEENLKNANPDLIISQETCEVCAAYTNQVNKAVQILQKKPMLFSMDPHNMNEIINSVTELGKIIDKKEKAKEITDSLSKRIEKIRKNTNAKEIKVLAIEWIEPFFTAGHWVPEMIEIAGGINMISKTGEHSRRSDIDEIINANPDIIILMPCGFDTQRTIKEYEKFLKNNEKWKNLKAVKMNKIFAVDANSFFSKPSIRTIDGSEILAKIIQPEIFEELTVPDRSFAHIEND